ncbi:ly-6/neurotoxin-like protein 1 [Exaiptasia diaphana]|uniref:Uncharacterized protein n=1 Tax=Exaiptasia diaphana TaxID=2652724 RepID=A0A913WWM2_EXADI|nr:ly-6/neurotoxin-like protein 1 [Exaiptasia diaphana]KXJ17334.1 hypothetical protein AC249_AIPGENE16322 [Exaiptasia diaphana]
MKFFDVVLVVLAIAIPAAVCIECYECTNSDGNCKENKKDCNKTMLAVFATFDRCFKIKTGQKVSKGCTTKSYCETKSFCKNITETCTASCCDSDLCNASTTEVPTIILITVALLVTASGILETIK